MVLRRYSERSRDARAGLTQVYLHGLLLHTRKQIRRNIASQRYRIFACFPVPVVIEFTCNLRIFEPEPLRADAESDSGVSATAVVIVKPSDSKDHQIIELRFQTVRPYYVTISHQNFGGVYGELETQRFRIDGLIAEANAESSGKRIGVVGIDAVWIYNSLYIMKYQMKVLRIFPVETTYGDLDNMFYQFARRFREGGFWNGFRNLEQ